jgi:hypothetical protein
MQNNMPRMVMPMVTPSLPETPIWDELKAIQNGTAKQQNENEEHENSKEGLLLEMNNGLATLMKNAAGLIGMSMSSFFHSVPDIRNRNITLRDCEMFKRCLNASAAAAFEMMEDTLRKKSNKRITNFIQLLPPSHLYANSGHLRLVCAQLVGYLYHQASLRDPRRSAPTRYNIVTPLFEVAEMHKRMLVELSKLFFGPGSQPRLTFLDPEQQEWGTRRQW